MNYQPETSQIDRANLLKSVREEAKGPGVDLLRQVLMDLDKVEAVYRGMVKALEPVRDWFESDEHPPRPEADIVKDAVESLEEDRQQALKFHRVKMLYNNHLERMKQDVRPDDKHTHEVNSMRSLVCGLKLLLEET